MNAKKIITVLNATFAVAKRKPEKKIQVCVGFKPLTTAIVSLTELFTS